MSGRFLLYTDADIRGPLIKQLERAGWDVVRGVDEYPERTRDPVHLSVGSQLGRVLVTSDEDQEAIAAEWYRARRSFPGLIIWRQELNEQMGYGALLKAFEDLARQDDPFGEYPAIWIFRVAGSNPRFAVCVRNQGYEASLERIDGSPGLQRRAATVVSRG